MTQGIGILATANQAAVAGFVEVKDYGVSRLSVDGKNGVSGGVLFGRRFRRRNIGSGGNGPAEPGQTASLFRTR